MLGALALTLLLYDACVRRWNVVGWRVAEELAARSAIASRAEVDYHAGGGLSLMERLVGYDRVILIDALHSDIDMMGSVRAFHLNDLGNLAAGHLSSSHDTTLKNAMEAAQAIGLKLPHDVRVVAIESPCVYDFATQLAPQVEAAVPRATQTVEEILGMWKQKNWT